MSPPFAASPLRPAVGPTPPGPPSRKVRSRSFPFTRRLHAVCGSSRPPGNRLALSSPCVLGRGGHRAVPDLAGSTGARSAVGVGLVSGCSAPLPTPSSAGSLRAAGAQGLSVGRLVIRGTQRQKRNVKETRSDEGPAATASRGLALCPGARGASGFGGLRF